MKDQRVILGPALSGKDTPHGGGVETVSPQPIDGFGRDAQQATIPEDGGGGVYRGGAVSKASGDAGNHPGSQRPCGRAQRQPLRAAQPS